MRPDDVLNLPEALLGTRGPRSGIEGIGSPTGMQFLSTSADPPTGAGMGILLLIDGVADACIITKVGVGDGVGGGDINSTSTITLGDGVGEKTASPASIFAHDWNRTFNIACAIMLPVCDAQLSGEYWRR